MLLLKDYAEGSTKQSYNKLSTEQLDGSEDGGQGRTGVAVFVWEHPNQPRYIMMIPTEQIWLGNLAYEVTSGDLWQFLRDLDM